MNLSDLTNKVSFLIIAVELLYCLIVHKTHILDSAIDDATQIIRYAFMGKKYTGFYVVRDRMIAIFYRHSFLNLRTSGK